MSQAEIGEFGTDPGPSGEAEQGIWFGVVHPQRQASIVATWIG